MASRRFRSSSSTCVNSTFLVIIMRDPVKEFERHCRDRWKCGPRLAAPPASLSPVFEHLRGNAHQWIRTVRRDEHSKNHVEVYFDYVDNVELNAFADDVEGYGYVAVYKGTILLLYDMFSRMLAHPEVLKEIGDSGRESINVQHTEGMIEYIDEQQEVRKLENRPVETIIPIDPIRRAFVQLAVMMAFDFLMTHELTHIQKGHCKYLDSLGTHFILARKQGAKGTDPFIRQSLESDADSQGAGGSLFSWLERIKSPEQLSPPMRLILPTPEKVVSAFLFSVFGLFRLWNIDNEIIDPNSLRSFLYPPLLVRQTMVLMGIGKATAPYFTSTKTLELIHAANVESMKAVRCIGGDIDRDVALVNSLTLNDPRVFQHGKDLINKFNELKSELRGHWYMREDTNS
jgi:hypothetical protein